MVLLSLMSLDGWPLAMPHLPSGAFATLSRRAALKHILRFFGWERARIVSRSDETVTEWGSAYFGTIEMTPLKKLHREIKYACLPRFEFKYLSTLRRRTVCAEFGLACAKLRWFFHHDPSPTFRTGDARARNPIRHSEIILRAGTDRFLPTSSRGQHFVDSRSFVAVRTVGGDRNYPRKTPSIA